MLFADGLLNFHSLNQYLLQYLGKEYFKQREQQG